MKIIISLLIVAIIFLTNSYGLEVTSATYQVSSHKNFKERSITFPRKFFKLIIVLTQRSSCKALTSGDTREIVLEIVSTSEVDSLDQVVIKSPIQSRQLSISISNTREIVLEIQWFLLEIGKLRA